jgi:hypothetical protein
MPNIIRPHIDDLHLLDGWIVDEEYRTGLWTVNSTKTIKSLEYGYQTFILYLSPAGTIKGINLCPYSDAECRSFCLYTAGRGAYSPVQWGRIRKTLFYWHYREQFYSQLYAEMAKCIAKAQRKGLKACFRFNGTSDRIKPPTLDDLKFAALLAAKSGKPFADCVASVRLIQTAPKYDYTKNLRAVLTQQPGYHLTYSFNSRTTPLDIHRLIESRRNMAVIFSNELPDQFLGLDVICGDDHDMRFQDPSDRSYIVGLLAKGQARDLQGQKSIIDGSSVFI